MIFGLEISIHVAWHQHVTHHRVKRPYLTDDQSSLQVHEPKIRDALLYLLIAGCGW